MAPGFAFHFPLPCCSYRASRGADVASDGKVPVLIEKGAEAGGADLHLTESAVIADYVAAKFAPRLLPPTPLHRARAALFSEQVISKVIRAWYSWLSAQDEAAAAAGSASMDAALAAVDAALADPAAGGGPFFCGADLTLSDLLLWPWLARWSVLTHWRKAGPLPEAGSEKLPALGAYVSAMRARDSARTTQQEDAYYCEGYTAYATGSRKPA